MSKTHELSKSIHEKRIQIMMHYLSLYGDKLLDRETLYDRFSRGEVSPASDEGEECMEAIMDMELAEQELISLIKRHRATVMRQVKKN
ncbi:hypothetical protein M4R22_02835 [Acidovorax sp. GBBC 3334]|uniref:hypothetical protein n=1 Tax=Acidovorax sp. GBBC 3334 TaxID=2940496 RepID=UPI002302E59E|nr:hypothetical protein [Acidovorax sp. GBBC 3334]MDA8453692.1 hypothetical protein [Acidovorax sp. GBBC 3334]